MIVIRSKPADRHKHKPGFSVERMLDWPDGSVSASRRFPGDSWEFVFKSDILKGKRKVMEQNLKIKRKVEYRQRALFVWVFWCPGIGGFAFRGWWTYLVGVGGKEYHCGGAKGNVAGNLLSSVMQMFPVSNSHPLFGPVSHHEWMPLFAKRYQRGVHCGKPQGKAAVWAMINDDDNVREILNRKAG